MQCKGDIVVVDIKQHKSQFKNSNFTIKQSAKFFWHFHDIFICHGNGGRSRKSAICSIQWPIHETPLAYRRNNLPDASYTDRVIANFVASFVAMETGVDRGKMRCEACNGPSPKLPYRRKNLADISYRRQVLANFVPHFVAMATGVDREKMRFAVFNGPSPKTPL